MATMKNVQALLEKDFSALNAEIRRALKSEVALIAQVAEYIIQSGGKRLRPILHLLAAHALNVEGNKKHTMAAVIECIHTATLLHDDVVDESEMRRSQKSANAVFGNAASVLVGDFLYSRAFQMMVEIDSMPIMREMSDATNTIAEGEVLQLLNCHDANVSEARYMQVIHYKTARLFEAAARTAAILAGADAKTQKALGDYGMYLGTAFQLIDDVLDYSGDEAEIGKHLGDDLAEGKPTLPLIYVMNHGAAADVSAVKRAIESGGREDFKKVLSAINNTAALSYTQKIAQQEAQKAAAAIENVLPTSQYKNALLELPIFAVSRRN